MSWRGWRRFIRRPGPAGRPCAASQRRPPAPTNAAPRSRASRRERVASRRSTKRALRWSEALPRQVRGTGALRGFPALAFRVAERGEQRQPAGTGEVASATLYALVQAQTLHLLPMLGLDAPQEFLRQEALWTSRRAPATTNAGAGGDRRARRHAAGVLAHRLVASRQPARHRPADGVCAGRQGQLGHRMPDAHPELRRAHGDDAPRERFAVMPSAGDGRTPSRRSAPTPRRRLGSRRLAPCGPAGAASAHVPSRPDRGLAPPALRRAARPAAAPPPPTPRAVRSALRPTL